MIFKKENTFFLENAYRQELICIEGCVRVCIRSDLPHCCVSISQVGADGMHLTLDLIYPFIYSILVFIAPIISLSLPHIPGLFHTRSPATVEHHTLTKNKTTRGM